MFLEMIWAFLSTLCFAVLFHVEKKQLLFCGITGSLGWLVYATLLNTGLQSFIATFYSTLLITFLARLFAGIRKTPITVFLTTGVITLVPGSGMYYTMLNIISHNNEKALFYGIETLKIAGAIAIGIILILSLPNKIFNLTQNKNKVIN